VFNFILANRLFIALPLAGRGNAKKYFEDSSVHVYAEKNRL
jgi:hypothetical protein